MKTEMNFRNSPNRAQLDHGRFDRQHLDRQHLDPMCARFAGLCGADAAHWLAAGDRLAVALQALGRRLAQLRVQRRAERRDADRLAYGL